jgi:hypothetical protein
VEGDTAQCDMCGATDTSVVYNNDNAWLPVLACNSLLSPALAQLEFGEPLVLCDGINHRLDPFNAQSGMDCYWWYQGGYPNGWIYWQGDWRCGPCAVESIFGARV